MKVLCSLFALAVASLPAMATAQNQTPEPDAASRTAAARTTAQPAEDVGPPGPAGRTENVLDGVAFDLEVSDEEPQASLQLGGFLTRTRPGTGDEPTRQSNWLWSAKLSVPVGGTDDLSQGSTLDALSNGTRFTFNISNFWFSSAAENLFSPTFIDYMRSARENCARQAAVDPDLDALQREVRMRECRDTRVSPAFARRYSDASPAAVNRALFGGMWRVGAEGSIGFDRFGYIESATLSESRDSKVQYSAAAFATYFPSDAMSAVIVRGEYQNAFEAAEEGLVCRPVVADPEEDCAHGVTGPPTNIERLNFSLEYRRIFDTRWRRGSFAISPRAMVDALSGEVEAEIPVYFIPRSASPISPGLKVSYSSEDDAVDFGIFLRTTFSL